MKLPFTLLLFIGTSILTHGQDLVSTTTKLVASLDEKSKAKAVYPLEDPERFNWHFVPRKRNGLSFNQMNAGQRELALAMLRLSLSEQGFKKASDIMALENILKVIENRGATDNYRDPLNYYVTIFGTPSHDKPWFWRLEGHHVALNFSSSADHLVSSTPTFWGSNPGIVPSGDEKGRQILKMEADLGFELVNSLNEQQKEKCIIGGAPAEIITGNDIKAALPELGGLPYGEMTEQQKSRFMDLLNVYVKNYELGFSNTLARKIRDAGIEKLFFGWGGSLTPGAANYYRISSPVLLIEFDNTQNNANHIHTVVRDLTNDFAEDILREHYRKEH